MLQKFLIEVTLPRISAEDKRFIILSLGLTSKEKRIRVHRLLIEGDPAQNLSRRQTFHHPFSGVDFKRKKNQGSQIAD